MHMTKTHRLFFTAAFLLVLALPLLAAPAFAARVSPSGERSGSRGQVSGDQLFQEAEALYRRGALDEALKGYQAYLERFPQGALAPWARLREAELVGVKGDWDGALRRYQALLAQEPPPEVSLRARYDIGQAYFKLAYFDRASQVLENLTASELPRPLRFSTNALLTEIALKKGNLPQAFARLRLAAQDLSEGEEEWFQDLKTRLVEQASPADLEQLARTYRDSPLSAVLLLRLAQLAQKVGALEEAARWVATLKERFPESPEALMGQRLLISAKKMVGCLLPLSGSYAEFGRRARQGMELALNDSSVELIFKDCPNDPAAAAGLVRDLAQNPRVLALLGPINSRAAEGAAQAAQEVGIPLIALSQKEGLTRIGDLIFRAFVTPRLQVRALVRHTTQKLGFRNYAALYSDSPYGRTLARDFQDEVTAQGGHLVIQSGYIPESQDFSLALTSLVAAYKPGAGSPPAFDAVFIPDDAHQVAAIAAQMAAGPLAEVQLLGTNLLSGPDAATRGGALEGVLFADAFYPEDPDPSAQEFLRAFRQKYGQTPDYLAAQGYAAARLLGQLLSGAPLTRGEIPSRLLDFKGRGNLPWLQGFNQNREAEINLRILTIRGGQVRPAPESQEIKPRR